MFTKKNAKKSNGEGLKPLQKLTMFFFNRPRKTAVLWLILAVFGVASYTTLLNREGFPAIETPFAVAQGAYLVNDPAKVDQEVAKPLGEFLVKQDGVKTIQSSAQGNFYSVVVSYEEGVNSAAKSSELQNQIASKGLIPQNATLELKPYEFGFTERGDDLVVSFYSKEDVPLSVLSEKAQKAADYFKSKNLSLVENVSIIKPYQEATNPATGQSELTQQSFDRFGKKEGDKNDFYNSVVIGFNVKSNVDNLELDRQVQSVVDELNANPEFSGYHLQISASYAPQINAQVNELQQVLLEGLLAVLLVGSLVIAIRASILTVISMVSVLAIVNGLLYAIGYSLNTITLFSLILALSLIIDDTIIMVEALDAQRRRQKKAAEAVKVAVGKVSRAMVAATLTAALSFAPLIFVGGILGEFIRAIPVTIISALLVSLVVALIFIPLFARFILLSKNQMAQTKPRSGIFNFEHKIAEFLAKPMLWAKNSKKKLAGVGIIAVLVSFGFIGASGYFFQKVSFNIFPPSKDANQLIIIMNMPPQTDIAQAEATVDRADRLIGDTLGQDFVKASYYGMANNTTASITVELTDYKKRGVKAPELVDKLNDKFAEFEGANAQIAVLDVGPPISPFSVHIDSDKNREAALKLREDLKLYLRKSS